MQSCYGEAFCQSQKAAPLDALVSGLVLQALEPAAIEASSEFRLLELLLEYSRTPAECSSAPSGLTASGITKPETKILLPII
jgi:hypothetical protein